MTYQNLLDLARRGNIQAIDVLLNRVFRSSGITAKTAVKEGCLHLLLESEQVPNQQTLVPAIRGAIVNLGVNTVDKMVVYGRQSGMSTPAWSQTILLEPYPVAVALEETVPKDINLADSFSSGGAVEYAEASHPLVSEPGHEADSILDALPTSEPEEVGSKAAADSDIYGNGTVRNPVEDSNEFSLAEDNFLERSSEGGSPGVVNLPTFNGEAAGSGKPFPVLEKGDIHQDGSFANGEDLLEKPSATTYFRAGRNLAIAGLGVLTLGIIGWHSLVVSQQNEVLDKAKEMKAMAVTAENATNVNSLRAAEQQLQEAANLLRVVPSAPGLAGRQKEQELAKIDSQLKAVRQRLKVEEAAVTNFSTARKLANEAIKAVQSSKRSLTTLQGSQAKLEKSITLLSSIPDETFISAAVKQKLAIYRGNATAVNKLIAAEQQEQQSKTRIVPKASKKRK
ncbi:hypothetical protein BST81_22005 [Leptolyngbya sp. 'hensonii']|uniref:hypothetical protein n=1 Tax=Leptolyngbya sp. 'hensonii' TaxID=1922337 RepID=UPI00094F6B5B|nr:hypothetical protein [Leptolyngbya sp. 'hensonii']OLP16277.1 hypothetical protein BST81_22005 [Leptolyngbya sp. 'hensonii']